jgi:hypothetical protein
MSTRAQYRSDTNVASKSVTFSFWSARIVLAAAGKNSTIFEAEMRRK